MMNEDAIPRNAQPFKVHFGLLCSILMKLVKEQKQTVDFL